MRLQLIILILFLFENVHGQELTKEQMDNFVFQISSTDCLTKATGFMIADHQGIYTSLHAVVGCKYLTAQNASTTYNGLTIILVDIEHDVAVLSSKELEVLKGGLFMSATKIKGAMDVHIWPYSYGIDIIMDSKSYLRRIHPLVSLKTIAQADPTTFKQLKERKSPSLDIDVLNIQGGLKPGASGAPITFNGKVVGIGGGEIRTLSDYCFGVPLRDIRMSDASSQQATRELTRLASIRSPTLFAYEPDRKNGKSSLQGILLSNNTLNKNGIVTISIGYNNFTSSFGPLEESKVYWPFAGFSLLNLPLSVRLKNNQLLFSCTFRDTDGKPIAQITDNEWEINPNNYFRRNFDKNGLEVTDEDGVIRFQIDFTDMNNLKITGIFVIDQSICIILPVKDPKARNLYLTPLEKISKEEIRKWGELVPYMFVYPSESHFGERAK